MSVMVKKTAIMSSMLPFVVVFAFIVNDLLLKLIIVELIFFLIIISYIIYKLK